MSRDPIIRRTEFGTTRIHAVGGLHYIKGNAKPYFTLTIESWSKGKEGGFGADHASLVKRWPELAPLAALHLSDIDGVPMHAAANGLYWLAGAARGGLGQEYHGGTGQFAKTPDECLAVVAEHFRISLNEARGLLVALELFVERNTTHYGRVYERKNALAAKAFVQSWVDAQRPRWKAEADKCRSDLGLVIYGDPWQEAA